MTEWHIILDPYNRTRRQFIELNFASNKQNIKPYLKVKGNNNNVVQSFNGSDPDVTSDGLKTANKIFRDGSDLLGAPSRWFNDMQQNWFGYIVVTAIILICVLFLYCIIRDHCSRQQKRRSDISRLVDLTTNKV